MIRPRHMMIPGIIAGSLLLLITGLLLRSTNTVAVPLQPAAEEIPVIGVVEEITSPQDDSQLGCSINQSFPESIQRYCSWITLYARGEHLDPDLVAAVILQESSGNPGAISGSGAVGLMQVMPRDGAAASFYCVNGPCFSGRPTTAELLDPEYNIEFGTALLADLINRRGDSREGLMAYGPENIGYSYADTVLDLYQQYRE